MRIYQRDLYRKNWRLSLIKFHQLLLHVCRSVWRISLWSLGRTKNGTFLGVCLKVDFHYRVIFAFVRA